MVTKIKATVYAARLRKKLAELKKARPKQVEAYHAGVAQWRKQLSAWIGFHSAERVKQLTPAKKLNHWARNEGRSNFDVETFFRGAPNPPEWPDDKQIREIQNLLRHLGITGQETVQVSTEDVARLLGGPDDVEED